MSAKRPQNVYNIVAFWAWGTWRAELRAKVSIAGMFNIVVGCLASPWGCLRCFRIQDLAFEAGVYESQ